MKNLVCALTIFTVAIASGCTRAVESKDAVILVTLDGLRWQDVFRGADTTFMNETFGGMDEDQAAASKSRFWDTDLDTRRRLLMPFLLSTLAANGTLFGNGDAGSTVRVTNDQLFSYPGYNELLTGQPDPAIDSNAKVNNENVTVLEWINAQPGFDGQVAAFGSWDVFPFIINEDRSGVLVDAGWDDEPLVTGEIDKSIEVLQNVSDGMFHLWPEVRFDALTIAQGLEFYRNNDVRVLYLALDETDTQAHAGRYDLYLDAVNRLDAQLRIIWETAQAHQSFGGRTTLIVTSDHGRGRTGLDWTDHGVGLVGADETWLGVIGPYTPAGGVAGADGGEPTLAQVAATLAAAVALDFLGSTPDAAPPIEGIIVR